MAYALLDLFAPPVRLRPVRGPALKVRHPTPCSGRPVAEGPFRDLEDQQVARAIQPVGPEDRIWRLFGT
jgi:hypothetical protein